MELLNVVSNSMIDCHFDNDDRFSVPTGIQKVMFLIVFKNYKVQSNNIQIRTSESVYQTLFTFYPIKLENILKLILD
jgi:hypothetical protein